MCSTPCCAVLCRAGVEDLEALAAQPQRTTLSLSQLVVLLEADQIALSRRQRRTIAETLATTAGRLRAGGDLAVRTGGLTGRSAMRMQAPMRKRFQVRQAHHGVDLTPSLCACARCVHADVATGSRSALCCGMFVSMSAPCEVLARRRARA